MKINVTTHTRLVLYYGQPITGVPTDVSMYCQRCARELATVALMLKLVMKTSDVMEKEQDTVTQQQNSI